MNEQWKDVRTDLENRAWELAKVALGYKEGDPVTSALVQRAVEIKRTLQ